MAISLADINLSSSEIFHLRKIVCEARHYTLSEYMLKLKDGHAFVSTLSG